MDKNISCLNECTNHNRQKKIAVINDVTGFGRCSVAVELPIISKLRIQCCPVPTAILSNQTGFSSFFIDDYTKHFTKYTDEWKKLNLIFDGICSGFIGSTKQIRLISSFIDEFKTSSTIVVVDPVMGDHGKLYSSYTKAESMAMRDLAKKADIITPNLTEACLLTDTPFHNGHWTQNELKALMFSLEDLGPKKIVITGIPQDSFVANLCCSDGVLRFTRQAFIGSERNGTGDVFTAIIAADAVNNVPFIASVRRASHFVKKCIIKSDELGIPNTDGVAFEEVLDSLHIN